MHCEFGGLPSRHGGVTLHANVVNSCGDVVGIGGGIVIRLMAGETLCRRVGKISRNMTLAAIIDGMTLGQGKACVIKDGGLPSWHGGVALHANVVNSRRRCDWDWWWHCNPSHGRRNTRTIRWNSCPERDIGCNR